MKCIEMKIALNTMLKHFRDEFTKDNMFHKLIFIKFLKI